MAGSDRRTQKTVRAIKEELLRQMLYKKYNELTVSGICAALIRYLNSCRYCGVLMIGRAPFQSAAAGLYAVRTRSPVMTVSGSKALPLCSTYQTLLSAPRSSGVGREEQGSPSAMQ